MVAAVAVSALVREFASVTEPTGEWAAFSECPLGERCYIGTVTTSVEDVSNRKLTHLNRTNPVVPALEDLTGTEHVINRDMVLREQEGQGEEVVASGLEMSKAAVCV
jgi:hypothetical protein